MDDIVKKDEERTVTRVIYYILGILEALFAFRLVFKLLGANPTSGFVAMIYSITGIFLAPFSGIFPQAQTKGLETQAVLEPMTIISMIVYALIAWGIVRFIIIMKNRDHDHPAS